MNKQYIFIIGIVILFFYTYCYSYILGYVKNDGEYIDRREKKDTITDNIIEKITKLITIRRANIANMNVQIDNLNDKNPNVSMNADDIQNKINDSNKELVILQDMLIDIKNMGDDFAQLQSDTFELADNVTTERTVDELKNAELSGEYSGTKLLSKPISVISDGKFKYLENDNNILQDVLQDSSDSQMKEFKYENWEKVYKENYNETKLKSACIYKGGEPSDCSKWGYEYKKSTKDNSPVDKSTKDNSPVDKSTKDN